jgi:hypothetical protein
MKYKLHILYIISIFLFVNIKNEDMIQVTITAMTGIINKQYDRISKEFSFQIDCEVDKNITNNITKIDITIKVKNLDVNDKIYENVVCHLVPVRVFNEGTATTNIFCIIENINKNELTKESNIIVEYIPSNIEDNDVNAKLTFENFDKIKENLPFEELTLMKLDTGFCQNNNYLFDIEFSQTVEKRPLLSTICNIALSEDQAHPIANCAIPLTGNKIKCFVDVSNKKYKKDDQITIKAQGLVPCENGQHMEIANDATNSIKISEDCGEIINNGSEFINFSKIFRLLFLCLFIFL